MPPPSSGGDHPAQLEQRYGIESRTILSQFATSIILKLNDPPAQEWAFWNVAAYHTGNIEAYRVTGNERYRRYSEAWAEHNQWMGAKSQDKTAWKYTSEARPRTMGSPSAYIGL